MLHRGSASPWDTRVQHYTSLQMAWFVSFSSSTSQILGKCDAFPSLSAPYPEAVKTNLMQSGGNMKIIFIKGKICISVSINVRDTERTPSG